tara:strand:+ start:425 stop:856 length:432 start_codon:yes stop_codon:yes gene_type:complete
LENKNLRYLPTIRRTKDQIAKDALNYPNCKKCNEPLRNSNIIRDKPKMCPVCRGEEVGGNSEIRIICKKLNNQNIPVSEDEMIFEDDPIAYKEIDNGKYFSKPLEVSFGVSPLSEIMKPNVTPPLKNGSATKGVRYSYKKKRI